MRAIVLQNSPSIDNLSMVERPIPRPRRQEILIKSALQR